MCPERVSCGMVSSQMNEFQASREYTQCSASRHRCDDVTRRRTAAAGREYDFCGSLIQAIVRLLANQPLTRARCDHRWRLGIARQHGVHPRDKSVKLRHVVLKELSRGRV